MRWAAARALFGSARPLSLCQRPLPAHVFPTVPYSRGHLCYCLPLTLSLPFHWFVTEIGVNFENIKSKTMGVIKVLTKGSEGIKADAAVIEEADLVGPAIDETVILLTLSLHRY